MKRKLILIGGGGHCISSIDVIESTGIYDIIGILDISGKVGQEVLTYKVLGVDDDIETFIKDEVDFIVTIGHIKNPVPRIKAFESLQKNNASIATVVSKYSIVSKYANIERGTMVFHHAVVNAGVRIGINSIINTAAVVEHETIVGGHTQVSTMAVINGQSIIGNRCFIGSNCIVNNNISICDDVVVASGSRVYRNINEPGIYIGNPVRKKE